MPDPKDTHTMALAAERKIMEMTGASRSEIRASAIGTPLRDALIREQSNRTPNNSNVVAPPPPKIESVEQSFRAQPLTLGDTGSTGGNPFDTGVTGTPVLCEFFANGLLCTGNLMGDGATPIPVP